MGSDASSDTISATSSGKEKDVEADKIKKMIQVLKHHTMRVMGGRSDRIRNLGLEQVEACLKYRIRPPPVPVTKRNIAENIHSMVVKHLGISVLFLEYNLSQYDKDFEDVKFPTEEAEGEGEGGDEQENKKKRSYEAYAET